MGKAPRLDEIESTCRAVLDLCEGNRAFWARRRSGLVYGASLPRTGSSGAQFYPIFSSRGDKSACWALRVHVLPGVRMQLLAMLLREAGIDCALYRYEMRQLSAVITVSEADATVRFTDDSRERYLFSLHHEGNGITVYQKGLPAGELKPA